MALQTPLVIIVPLRAQRDFRQSISEGEDISEKEQATIDVVLTATQYVASLAPLRAAPLSTS